MNKGELLDTVAEKAGVSKKVADAVVSATIDAIMEAVSSGDKVTLVGFGSFEPRDRKQREGRNPKTGETMTIPATTVPAFSAGKAFKEKVAAQTTKTTIKERDLLALGRVPLKASVNTAWSVLDRVVLLSKDP